MIPMDSSFIASLSYMPELFASPKELFTESIVNNFATFSIENQTNIAMEYTLVKAI